MRELFKESYGVDLRRSDLYNTWVCLMMQVCTIVFENINRDTHVDSYNRIGRALGILSNMYLTSGDYRPKTSTYFEDTNFLASVIDISNNIPDLVANQPGVMGQALSRFHIELKQRLYMLFGDNVLDKYEVLFDDYVDSSVIVTLSPKRYYNVPLGATT